MSAADLEALAAEAAAVDAEHAPQPQADEAAPKVAQAQPPADEVAELTALISITVGLFAPLFPSLRTIYTPQTVDQIAQAAVPVMRKHGWSTGNLLGQYAEELALAAVVAPVAMATWRGIQSDLAARKAESSKGAKPEPVQPQIEHAAAQPMQPIRAAHEAANDA